MLGTPVSVGSDSSQLLINALIGKVKCYFTSPVIRLTRWDEKAGLHGMRYAPNNRRARSTRERRPAVKKISTVATNRNEIFKEPKLTIGLDLGDRSSHYCILDEAGEVILEHGLPTTPQGIHQVFSRS